MFTQEKRVFNEESHRFWLIPKCARGPFLHSTASGNPVLPLLGPRVFSCWVIINWQFCASKMVKGFQKTAISPYFIIFHLFLIHLPTFHFQVGLPTKKTRKSQFWMTFHRLARKDSNRIGSVWVFQMIPPNGRFIRRTAYFHLFSESLRQENPPFL